MELNTVISWQEDSGVEPSGQFVVFCVMHVLPRYSGFHHKDMHVELTGDPKLATGYQCVP